MAGENDSEETEGKEGENKEWVTHFSFFQSFSTTTASPMSSLTSA